MQSWSTEPKHKHISKPSSNIWNSIWVLSSAIKFSDVSNHGQMNLTKAVCHDAWLLGSWLWWDWLHTKQTKLLGNRIWSLKSFLSHLWDIGILFSITVSKLGLIWLWKMQSSIEKFRGSNKIFSSAPQLKFSLEYFHVYMSVHIFLSFP